MCVGMCWSSRTSGVFANFHLLSDHFLGGSEENHKNKQSGQLIIRPGFELSTREIEVHSVTYTPVSSLIHLGIFKHLSQTLLKFAESV